MIPTGCLLGFHSTNFYFDGGGVKFNICEEGQRVPGSATRLLLHQVKVYFTAEGFNFGCGYGGTVRPHSYPVSMIVEALFFHR